jgi:hypothetical protein
MSDDDDLRVVATVENETEAEMVEETLTEVGIRSVAQMRPGGIRLGPAAARDIYVEAGDYERAVEALAASVPSEAELTALSEEAGEAEE